MRNQFRYSTEQFRAKFDEKLVGELIWQVLAGWGEGDSMGLHFLPLISEKF